MYKATLLDAQYDLRLTMGAISTFTALSGEQVDYAYKLLSSSLNEGYAPSGEDQLKIVAFVYACYKSACVLSKQTPVDFEIFLNTISLEDTYQAFVGVLAAEIETRELKKNSPLADTPSSTPDQASK